LRKGIAPIAVALIALIAIIAIEGVIVTNFIFRIESVVRTIREGDIIIAINKIEFAKKALKSSVSFSFYEAAFTVLKMGGFCKEPSVCLIPQEVPSLKCMPWWRIYDKTYSPDPPDQSIKIFLSYLENRTSYIFDRYSKSFEVSTPRYYPQPPGSVTVEELNGGVRINISSEDKGGTMSLAGEFFEITDNANFADDVTISTTKIYRLGKERFIDVDSIKNAFIEADKRMPNSCEDMEKTCGVPKNPACVDPDSSLCGYKNKDTCKYMWFDGVCENQLPNCEAELEKHCCRDGDGCDFNDDGKVSADERYNCTVIEEIKKLEEPVDDIKTGIDIGLIKVGHSFQLHKGETVSCDWRYDKPDGACCKRVADEKCCGCEDKCVKDEDCNKNPQCTSEGKCPSSSEYACPSDGCGYWKCSEKCVEYDCQAPCTIDNETYDTCPPCPSPCVKWDCDFSWNCRSNVCGYECCEETVGLVEDVECKKSDKSDYTYFGAANVTVDVWDDNPYSIYPIYGAWQRPHLYFRVVSGTMELVEAGIDEECKAV